MLAIPRTARAQWSDAVAVSTLHETSTPPDVRVLRKVPPNNNAWQAGSFWRWTAVGLLAGALAADGWAALQMAHSDDGSMTGPIFPLVFFGAVGGVGGGLIGAIAYTASHPGAQPSPQ